MCPVVCVIQSHPGPGHPGSQGRWLIIRIRVIWLDLPLVVLNCTHSVIWTFCLTLKTTFWPTFTSVNVSIWGKSLAWLPSMLMNDSSLHCTTTCSPLQGMNVHISIMLRHQLMETDYPIPFWKLHSAHPTFLTTCFCPPSCCSASRNIH